MHSAIIWNKFLWVRANSFSVPSELRVDYTLSPKIYFLPSKWHQTCATDQKLNFTDWRLCPHWTFKFWRSSVTSSERFGEGRCETVSAGRLPSCENPTRFSLFVSFCFAVRYCLKCFVSFVPYTKEAYSLAKFILWGKTISSPTIALQELYLRYKKNMLFLPLKTTDSELRVHHRIPKHNIWILLKMAFQNIRLCLGFRSEHFEQYITAN